jgi:hypothetical protein
MSDIQQHDGKSQKVPRIADEKSVLVVPIEDTDTVLPITPQAAAHASGDRVLVLMDLDNGLVGWESDDDPENPQ